MRIEPFRETTEGEYPFVSIGVRWIAETDEDAEMLQRLAREGSESRARRNDALLRFMAPDVHH